MRHYSIALIIIFSIFSCNQSFGAKAGSNKNSAQKTKQLQEKKQAQRELNTIDSTSRPRYESGRKNPYFSAEVNTINRCYEQGVYQRTRSQTKAFIVAMKNDASSMEL
jgi:hypothetical protein